MLTFTHSQTDLSAEVYALSGEDRIGSCLLSLTEEGPVLNTIHVEAPWRRRHLASAMLAIAEAIHGEARPDYLTPSGVRWWRGLGRKVTL